MAETDVFERRLRAALVRHTDGGPTDFDALGFARLVAEQEPRRHGLGAVLGWRAAGVPRLAWVLLLAGLLTAMVAGTLAVGAQLRRRDPAVVPPVVAAFVCPPGSNPDAPGPVGQERPVIGMASPTWRSTAARDESSSWRSLARAPRRGHSTCARTPGPGCIPSRTRQSAVQFDPLIYDADSDATIAIDGPARGSTTSRRTPGPGWASCPCQAVECADLAYDPVSGLVIAADAGELWSYDVEADTWASIAPVPWRAGLGAIAYDASVDRIVAYARGDMWLFDIRAGRGRGRVPTRRWSYAPWDGPTLRSSTTRRHGGRSSPATSAPCTTSTLRTTRPRIDGSPSPRTAGVPVLRVRPGQQAPRQPRDNRDSMVAFQLATRERMVLLGPGEGQPPPSSR